MKTRLTLTTLVALLCGCLVLAACTSGPATTGLSPTATAVPTVAKPTSFPTVNLTFCQRILTVAQANQFMQPSTPATSVVVGGSTPTGGSCNYQYGAIPPTSPHQIILAVILQAWNGPNPIPQSAIQAQIAQGITQAAGAGVPVPNYALQMVSGVGDEAAFASISFAPNPYSISKVTIFYVLYGKILFDCVNYFDASGTADAQQMSGLQQCGQTVVSRL